MVKRNREELVSFAKQKIAEITSMDLNDIDEHTEFINLKLDSVKTLFVLQELEDYLEVEINPLVFWDYPTIEKLSDYLSGPMQ